jgi:hypothetical protein
MRHTDLLAFSTGLSRHAIRAMPSPSRHFFTPRFCVTARRFCKTDFDYDSPFLAETEILPAQKKSVARNRLQKRVFDRFLFMAETIPAETLQQMVQSYEETLRLLIAKADDEERYYDFRHTPQSRYAISSLEIGRHALFQEIRRIAVYTLHRFHPEIPVRW